MAEFHAPKDSTFSGLARVSGVAALAFFAFVSAADSEPPANPDTFQSPIDATVFIKVERVFRNATIPTSGSGFFVNADGLLLTNWHVVAPQVDFEILGTHREVSTATGDIEVVTYSGTKAEVTVVARVLALDRARDLAILRVPLRPKAFLTFAAEPQVTIAAPIVAVGYPFGELVTENKGNPEATVTMGHVTALRHKDGQPDLVQIDAAVNPGNSGGPLLNEKHEVIGVICAGISGGNATSFAIAPEKLRAFIAENQVRVRLEPDAIWNRADPIKVTVSPLLLNTDSLRCRYRLEGSDVDPAQGELAPAQPGFAGTVPLPAVQPARAPASEYSLTLSLVAQNGETVYTRRFSLKVVEQGAERVRSDREPSAMMSDRKLFGNRTESGDAAVYLGPEATPPPKSTNRTALSDLASKIKLQRPPGNNPLSVDNQSVVRCRREPPEANYANLTGDDARNLARRFDIAECEFSQLDSDTKGSQYGPPPPPDYWDHSVRCTYEDNATQCDYYYATLQRATPSNKGRMQSLYDDMARLVGLLAERGMCRCQSGVWFERWSGLPPCRDCLLPKLSHTGTMSQY